MRWMIFGIVMVVAACGSSIEKEPNTVYVVVNGTNNTSGGTTGNTGGTNTANPNNIPTPNNVPDPVNNMTTAPNNMTTPPDPTNNMTTPPDPTNNMNPGQACNNAGDLEIVTSNPIPNTARDCALQCFQDADRRACTKVCIVEQTMLSDACSECVTDFTECGLNACFADCLEDPYADACIVCLQTNCDADFVQCSGIPPR